MNQIVCIKKDKNIITQKTNYILKNLKETRIFVEWRLIEFGKVFEVELPQEGQSKDASETYPDYEKLNEIRSFFKNLVQQNFSDPIRVINYHNKKSIFSNLTGSYEASVRNSNELLCQYEKDGQKLVVFFQRPQLKPDGSFIFSMFDCIVHINVFEDIMREIKDKYISLQERNKKDKNVKNFVRAIDLIYSYIKAKSTDQKKVYIHFLGTSQMIFNVYFFPSSLCLNCVKAVFEERNELERWISKNITRERLDSMISSIFNNDELIRVEDKFLKEEISKSVKMKKRELYELELRVFKEIFVRALLFYINNATATTFIKKHFFGIAYHYNGFFKNPESLTPRYYGKIFFYFPYPINLKTYEKDLIKRFFAILALRLVNDKKEIEEMVKSITLENIKVQLKEDIRYNPEFEFLLKVKERDSNIISIRVSIIEHFIRHGNNLGVIKNLYLSIDIEKSFFEFLKHEAYVQEILKVLNIVFPIQPGWEAIEFLSKIVNVAAFVKN